MFNIACGKSYSVLSLVQRINGILKKNIKPAFVPPRPGDIRKTLADISKLKRLCIENFISFEEGLKRTVNWFTSKSSVHHKET